MQLSKWRKETPSLHFVTYQSPTIRYTCNGKKSRTIFWAIDRILLVRVCDDVFISAENFIMFELIRISNQHFIYYVSDTSCIFAVSVQEYLSIISPTQSSSLSPPSEFVSLELFQLIHALRLGSPLIPLSDTVSHTKSAHSHRNGRDWLLQSLLYLKLMALVLMTSLHFRYAYDTGLSTLRLSLAMYTDDNRNNGSSDNVLLPKSSRYYDWRT